MATRDERLPTEPEMDPTDLWSEEIYTDRRVGTIRRMTPVRGDGTRDPARTVQWIGETQLLTQLGTLPISFPIEAQSLEEAARRFGAEAKKAIERTLKELQELRRQAASSILIPQAGEIPPLGPGGTPGGFRGGGKIQLP